MINSNPENNGKYTKLGFFVRAIELISPNQYWRYVNEHLPEISVIRKIVMAIDYYYSLIIWGAIPSDYFEYKFYNKRGGERNSYITMLKSIRIQKLFNTGGRQDYFVNKKKFNEYFKKYRDLKDFYFEDGSEKDFLDFIKDCNNQIIVKSTWGASGHGIYIPDISTEQKQRDLYQKLKFQANSFCEERFIQTGDLGNVNPHCVNTIRVYTIYDGMNVHIVNAVVRFGGSTDCVDNIHSGGMSCEIDIANGVIAGCGYNLHNKRFVVHPLTGCILPGLKVPQWEHVKKICEEVAILIPDMGYIGWDIAVSEDKICLIEGNEVANVNAPQTACQRGLWMEYKKIIDVVKK